MFRRIISVVVLALGLCAGVAGQDKPTGKVLKEELPVKSSFGRTALGLPEPTSAGTWDGTWIYVSRDERFALWFSKDQGKTIAKIRFEGTRGVSEAFETDWTGRATYSVQDLPGVFEFTLKNDDPDRLEADWHWVLDLRGSSRTENGDVTLYRSEDGRRMVMHFKNFERVIESAGGVRRSNAPHAWTFRKLSRRVALWEELPF
jgi:hypothetical protein